MKIDMFPAENGDAFIVRLDNNKNIIIDMGYSTTYNEYIKDSLIDMNDKGENIDLLVVTHIDEDHIEGTIEFIKENGDINNPNIIDVKEIWHNSYRNLQFDKEKYKSISTFERNKLEEIKLSDSGIKRRTINETQPISAMQGSTLAGYLYEFGYLKNRWNSSFSLNAVNLDRKNEIIKDNIKFTILSPDTKKLRRLSKSWMNKLEEIDIDFSISDEEVFDDAFEIYLKKVKESINISENRDISYNMKSYENIFKEKISKPSKDYSNSNGSSIAFILEYEGKKALFLGDSHEDIIVNRLENYKEDGNSLEFDIIKLSHHGSKKNNYKWIDIVNCDKYLISTNGKKHGHPNIEVISKILQTNNKHLIFYFNYPSEVTNILENENLKKKYNYSVIVGNGILGVEIGDRNSEQFR